jgi:prolycopene isomerase
MAMASMAAAGCALNGARVRELDSRLGPRKEYPAVGIGAGLGGLCCGAYLARQGIPVTVVEQHSVPGGYASSFRRGPGYEFEVSLHGTAIHENPTARILEELGVLSRIGLAQLPELYALNIRGRGMVSIPQRDPEAYIRLMCGLYPDEERGIRGFVNEMIAISDECDRLSAENPTVSGLFYKLRFPFRFRHMWEVKDKTLGDLLREYVMNPVLKEHLAALWGYYGLPPEKLSGFLYAVATGDYLKNGSYYIRKRSADLSSGLALAVVESGGRVLYGTRAERIIVEKGAVTGVELDRGDVLPARAVVSNASAPETFGKMVPEDAVPESYRSRIAACRPSLSSFVVWLGLKGDIWERIPHAHVYSSFGQFSDESYEAVRNGQIDIMPFGVSFYDNVFEGYSPPGRSTVTIMALSGYGPWKRFEQDYGAGLKEAYGREKERWARILVRRAEESILPGLSSMIEVMDAATPLTNRRYTLNTEGAISGFDQPLDNSFMTRLDNRPPVGGLYLSGAWSSPGGGYTGALMSGRLAFLKMMEDWAG